MMPDIARAASRLRTHAIGLLGLGAAAGLSSGAAADDDEDDDME